MADLVQIDIDLIDDHPDNPRLVVRHDVIDTISANLGSHYPKKHAIQVRPIGEHYQIVSGHHRKRAAEKAGLSEIWAWSEELDDHQALMELVTSNAQGELSPLEIGLHALKAVPPSEGGRGKRGGLSQYATAIGKTQGYVSQLRAAAEVATGGESYYPGNTFLDKTKHLAAIHKTEPPLWSALVRLMLERGWSKEETEIWVSRLSEFEIPDKWAEVFLDPVEVKTAFLETREGLSAKTVAALAARADAIETMIRTLRVDVDLEVAQFHTWLRRNKGVGSWNLRQLEKHEQELRQRLDNQVAARESAWQLGDWRRHVKGLQPESIALVLTDPPYGVEYQGSRRSHKQKKIANDSADQSVLELRGVLTALYPKLKRDSHVLCFCHWSKEPEVREVIEGCA